MHQGIGSDNNYSKKTYIQDGPDIEQIKLTYTDTGDYVNYDLSDLGSLSKINVLRDYADSTLYIDTYGGIDGQQFVIIFINCLALTLTIGYKVVNIQSTIGSDYALNFIYLRDDEKIIIN